MQNAGNDEERFLGRALTFDPAEDVVIGDGVLIFIDEAGHELIDPIDDEEEGTDGVFFLVFVDEGMFDIEENVGGGVVLIADDITVEEEIGSGASGEEIAMIDEGVGSGLQQSRLKLIEFGNGLCLVFGVREEVDPILTDESVMIGDEMMKEGCGRLPLDTKGGRENAAGMNLESSAFDAHIGDAGREGMFAGDNGDGTEGTDSALVDEFIGATFRGTAFDEVSEELDLILDFEIGIGGFKFVDGEREVGKVDGARLEEG